MSSYSPTERALLRCKWCNAEVQREEDTGVLFNCWTWLDNENGWLQSGVCIGMWYPIRVAELEAEVERLRADAQGTVRWCIYRRTRREDSLGFLVGEFDREAEARQIMADYRHGPEYRLVKVVYQEVAGGER